VLGLNISSAFRSAVTVYIMIPLLLIPQMILSGLIFSFDKLNNLISTKGKVPLVADLMASRWAYEAMAVYQFRNNDFESEYYDYERAEAGADFKAAYLADDLIHRNQFLLENFDSKDDSTMKKVRNDFAIIRNTLAKEGFREGIENLDLETYSKQTGEQLNNYLNRYKKHYQKLFNENAQVVEKKKEFVEKQGRDVSKEKNEFYNESLADLVTNVTTKNRLIEYKGAIVQQIDPIFQSPSFSNPLNYRTAFFFPEKNLFGVSVSTFVFDLLVVWSMSIVCYILLYFEVLRKFLEMFGRFRTSKEK
jgi:hypothetical protein